MWSSIQNHSTSPIRNLATFSRHSAVFIRYDYRLDVGLNFKTSEQTPYGSSLATKRHAPAATAKHKHQFLAPDEGKTARRISPSDHAIHTPALTASSHDNLVHVNLSDNTNNTDQPHLPTVTLPLHPPDVPRAAHPAPRRRNNAPASPHRRAAPAPRPARRRDTDRHTLHVACVANRRFQNNCKR